MRLKCRPALTFLLALAAVGLEGIAADAPPAAKVPDAVMKGIDESFRLKRRPQSREEYFAIVREQMEQAIRLGTEAEQKYPNAPDLHVVQSKMLMAADFLVRIRKGPEDRKRRLAIARRLLASKADLDNKVTADYFVTLDKVRPGGQSPAKDAEKQIRAFVARYAQTAEAPTALVRAAQLAKEAQRSALYEELLDRLQKGHEKIPAVNQFLRQAGRKTSFHAELTLVDGKKLSLPDDLRGKVLVIDFWAMWCPPCLSSLPHMKQVYARVKPKGVEFVGISLDRANAKDRLVRFVRDNGMTWLHAYSGKYWEDPTARQYGVRGIPSVWVIGKDGRVFSDNARADLEGTINRALAAPAPKKPKS